jgi:hypothetical protein
VVTHHYIGLIIIEVFLSFKNAPNAYSRKEDRHPYLNDALKEVRPFRFFIPTDCPGTQDGDEHGHYKEQHCPHS